MQALIAAQNLHTVSLYNVPVETIETDTEYAREGIALYVQMCLHVLTPLHATLQAKGEGEKIRDVLKFNRRLPEDQPHPTEINCPGPGHCFGLCFWHRPHKITFHLTDEE